MLRHIVIKKILNEFMKMFAHCLFYSRLVILTKLSTNRIISSVPKSHFHTWRQN